MLTRDILIIFQETTHSAWGEKAAKSTNRLTKSSTDQSTVDSPSYKPVVYEIVYKILHFGYPYEMCYPYEIMLIMCNRYECGMMVVSVLVCVCFSV